MVDLEALKREFDELMQNTTGLDLAWLENLRKIMFGEPSPFGEPIGILFANFANAADFGKKEKINHYQRMMQRRKNGTVIRGIKSRKQRKN